MWGGGKVGKVVRWKITKGKKWNRKGMGSKKKGGVEQQRNKDTKKGLEGEKNRKS